MIDAVMAKLEYIDPPVYKSYSSYRKYLRESTNFSCSYCTISESESPGATFNIEHFKPQKYFQELSAKCENLRYACPRCNSYKGDLWISEKAGCERNCERCTQKVCQKNIDRFIDTLNEKPSDVIYLADDDKLYAYSESKPAYYTIKYLRLNRAQLIKLRHVRRFMDSWLKELEAKRSKAYISYDEIKQKQSEFFASMQIGANDENKIYCDMILTMYEMLVVQAEQALLQIEEEIQKLNYLMSQRCGCDEVVGINK